MCWFTLSENNNNVKIRIFSWGTVITIKIDANKKHGYNYYRLIELMLKGWHYFTVIIVHL